MTCYAFYVMKLQLGCQYIGEPVTTCFTSYADAFSLPLISRLMSHFSTRFLYAIEKHISVVVNIILCTLYRIKFSCISICLSFYYPHKHVCLEFAKFHSTYFTCSTVFEYLAFCITPSKILKNVYIILI